MPKPIKLVDEKVGHSIIKMITVDSLLYERCKEIAIHKRVRIGWIIDRAMENLLTMPDYYMGKKRR